MFLSFISQQTGDYRISRFSCQLDAIQRALDWINRFPRKPSPALPLRIFFTLSYLLLRFREKEFLILSQKGLHPYG